MQWKMAKKGKKAQEGNLLQNKKGDKEVAYVFRVKNLSELFAKQKLDDLKMPRMAFSNHSHPNVAGGLFVASKYSASTNGSSAIL